MILALFQVCQLVNNGAGQEALFFFKLSFLLLIVLFLYVPQTIGLSKLPVNLH